MAGVGVGGLFSGLINPGLDERIAQHLTPNPNPLAQQGQPPGRRPSTASAIPCRPSNRTWPPPR